MGRLLSPNKRSPEEPTDDEDDAVEKLSGKKLRCYAGFQFLTGPGSREIGLF